MRAVRSASGAVAGDPSGAAGGGVAVSLNSGVKKRGSPPGKTLRWTARHLPLERRNALGQRDVLRRERGRDQHHRREAEPATHHPTGGPARPGGGRRGKARAEVGGVEADILDRLHRPAERGDRPAVDGDLERPGASGP